MTNRFQFAQPDGDLDWSKGNSDFRVMWRYAKVRVLAHSGKGFRVRRRAEDQGWTQPLDFHQLGSFLHHKLLFLPAGTLLDVKSERDGWKMTFRRLEDKPAYKPYRYSEWRAQVHNGSIPRNLLAPIEPAQYDLDLGGPALMHPEAAAAMSALLKAAPSGLRVKYSYRTLDKQWEKWRNYQHGGNLAATPGTSNHGWGLAVDFTGLSWGVQLWLRVNARRFGFVNDVPGESWHYTYQGGWH